MKFQLLLILAMLFSFTYQANAVNTVEVDADGTTISLTGEKQTVFNKVGTWFKTQKNKATSFIVKKAMAIDWNDDKLMLKYWIIALVGAIVLGILGSVLAVTTGSATLYLVLTGIGGLLGLAGTILFWYWVYLKFIK